ncbi:MAG: T9SS type A sorting domain-containing protein [Bacteroidales bacterium]|nr:MAG: T9SS type A sorting domain-containing protein [Bacteroidales bacterium]
MKTVVNKMPGKFGFFQKDKRRRLSLIIPVMLLLFIAGDAIGQYQIEDLNRGVVAVRKTDTSVFVSWRLLATDPDTISFNVYRGTTKVNDSLITNSTNFIDNGGSTGDFYHVKPVLGEVEQESSDTVPTWSARYTTVPLQRPAGGTTPDAVSYSYSPNDASTGDLDGDGEYEIVLKWDPSNSHDNAHSGYTGNVILDAYEIDGTHLWRIDLGINIRAGAHYTQFMVYDLDGDGVAELACKTAPGTKDGSGSYLSLGPAAGADHEADYRNSSGYILSGPEYFTIFDGETGNELATADYIVPRGSVSSWGDSYGNRVDRFLACVAYLDGERPSVVMCRGYYTRTVLAAWDWREGTLTHRWTFDSNEGYSSYAGQGNHNLSVGDVDFDGKDEIVYGQCAIDDDGSGLWTTGLGHGDAMHLADIDPDRPGLERWGITEPDNTSGSNLIDARTGTIIWQTPPGDIGRGTAGDLVASHFGMECWGGTDGLRSCKNIRVGNTPGSTNHVVWWDGDLTRELLNSNYIDKYGSGIQLQATGCSSNNGTKSNPCLQADILGDWREEVIWRTSDNTSLRIYTTNALTDYRITTLMHDHVYRLGIAWQNVAYNQPPHTGFYLGDGMFIHDSLRPPASPMNVFAIAWSDTVELHWDQSYDTDFAGYKVYRSKFMSGPFDTLTTDIILDTYYVDTDVINDTTYYYGIAAVDSFDNESSLAIVKAIPTIRPPVPEGLFAQTDIYSTKLFWNAVSADNIAGYNIYSTKTSGSGYSKLNAELLTDTSYLDSPLFGRPTYYYVVTSVDDNSIESFYSEEIVATPGLNYTLQAEDAVLGGTYYMETEHIGFHGTAYINFATSGTSVEFTNLAGLGGGLKTMVFRYALGNVDRTGALIVNDVTHSLTMESTGEWTNYTTDSTIIVLNDGFENTVRFESTGSDFGNLDEITIKFVPYTDLPENYFRPIQGEIELFQNIPNPFSGTTRIIFNVKEQCKASLTIYNILGQPVRTLLNNVLYEPGIHEVNWNACDNNGERVPGGVYLYRIHTNTNSYMLKKMLYIKDY